MNFYTGLRRFASQFRAENDFERLLEMNGESGPIDRVGDGYVIDESELGAVAFARILVRAIGGRLLRPFRLFRPAG